MRYENIEALLAGAEVLQDEYGDANIDASAERIQREVNEALWRSVMAWEDSAHRTGTIASPARRGSTAVLHEHAAGILRALSTRVLAHTQAASHIARLENSRAIEPEGALIFACLLDLAECEEGAQFWWQFCAGAGSAVSARCLYLLHMRRGELRDAEHWAHQAADLEDDSLHHGLDNTVAQQIEFQFTGADVLGDTTPPRALREAIRHLDTESDEDFGTIPHPNPNLADQPPDFVPAR